MSAATLEPPAETASRDFASDLRQEVIAIRLSFKRFGKSRTFNSGEKARVAREFDSDTTAVSASTRLYPAKRDELKAISTVLSQTRSDFIYRTIPYVEKGVRLLRKNDLEGFIESFKERQEELEEALRKADAHYEEIIEAQRAVIGLELFDRNDYPETFAGSVAIEWSTFNFEPNEELLKLAPSTYRREQQRVRQQFEESIAIFEEECKREMADMVQALLEKLKPAEEGEKKKVFRESTADNLREFFDRFEKLGVFSDQQMVELVNQARTALGDTKMSQVKKDKFRKAELSRAFQKVNETLETMLVDQAERSIDLSDLEDV